MRIGEKYINPRQTPLFGHHWISPPFWPNVDNNIRWKLLVFLTLKFLRFESIISFTRANNKDHFHPINHSYVTTLNFFEFAFHKCVSIISWSIVVLIGYLFTYKILFTHFPIYYALFKWHKRINCRNFPPEYFSFITQSSEFSLKS